MLNDDDDDDDDAAVFKDVLLLETRGDRVDVFEVEVSGRVEDDSTIEVVESTLVESFEVGAEVELLVATTDKEEKLGISDEEVPRELTLLERDWLGPVGVDEEISVEDNDVYMEELIVVVGVSEELLLNGDCVEVRLVEVT